MKRIPSLLCAMLILGTLSAARAAFPEDVRQALQSAVADAQKALAAAGLPAQEPISLLPFAGDRDGYVKGLLKSAITAAGLTYVEGREDPFWEEVLKEAAWDGRKADMLDPNTLTTFGRLKSSRILIYGSVRDFSSDGQKVFVEMELHASSLLTKQRLWGATFGKRFYVAKNLQGIVELDETVREVLQKAFAQGAESLRKSSKIQSIRTVVMAPLAGEFDNYATGLAESMITQSPRVPKNLEIRTLAEARTLLRDQPQRADAVLYGAARDLSRRMESPGFFSDTDMIRAEVQLRIENAAGKFFGARSSASMSSINGPLPMKKKA